ncbi:MAG: helix-turn-helix transcriptional regulator [Desulfobacteraceae bacterium]|nr:helix-turn-helix transcriptional regulator [Desulfobacteraceae bacterium]
MQIEQGLGNHGGMPGEKGEGEYRKIRFESGISATIMDYSLHRSITSKVETPRPALGFGFCLSGKTRTRIDCFKDEFIIQGGQSAFYYFPNIKVDSEASSEERVKRVVIDMPLEMFQGIVAEDPDAVPKGVRSMVNKERPDPFRAVEKLTPGMRKLLMQILNCSYRGAARRFFIEAKIMELMACKLDLMAKNQGTSTPAVKLKKDDVDRLHFARDLLVRTIEQPMELVELSRRVGVSRTKLLNGFVALFGTTPTSYLRDLRIEKARALIDQGRLSLTDIAHSVGYSSSSHFTKVFRNYFGVTPSQYASGSGRDPR